MNITEQIKQGMALAFFACAYADQADDCEQSLYGEIMAQLPDEIDPAALHAADTLAMGLEELNAKRPGWTLSGCYRFLQQQQRNSEDQGDRELTPELFGHYCAMQAMSQGVGLESFGRAVRDAVCVPYVEFGSYSLERDYFFEEPEADEVLDPSTPQPTQLSCKYGAPMGRPDFIEIDSHDPEDWPGTVDLLRLPMCDRDYDWGGAYWGEGNPTIGWMFWAYVNKPGVNIEIYVRAKSTKEAAAAIQERLPCATIVRH